MNEKLKILAKKIFPYFRGENLETPQDIFDQLGIVAWKQKDYFYLIKPESFIKLTLYIYSLKSTGGFDLAEKMINNLVFSEIFYTEYEDHKEECPECSGNGDIMCSDCEGNGTVECSNCDGKGQIDCDECDGTGKEECDECDGSGEVDNEECEQCKGEGEVVCTWCEGDGTRTCTDCNGAGDTSCWECSGSGRETCSECDGEGEISDDTYNYDSNFICTWDKQLSDLLEINFETHESFSLVTFFSNYSTKMIVLVNQENNSTFNDSVESERVYVISFDDNPNLLYTNRFKISEPYNARQNRLRDFS